MQCEVCGREIRGSGFRRVIDGAKLIVCSKCAKLGVSDWSEDKPPTVRKVVTKPKPRRVKRKTSGIEEELELIEGFGEIIREARRKRGLKHEDLGKMIGEKASVLKRVEKEKMIPDQNLTRKLEHTLHIKLLVKTSSIGKIDIPPVRSNGLTLGDIVKLKVRKGDDS